MTVPQSRAVAGAQKEQKRKRYGLRALFLAGLRAITGHELDRCTVGFDRGQDARFARLEKYPFGKRRGLDMVGGSQMVAVAQW
jgi:hypothetical protein